jgi:hypothetical protein
LFEARTKDRKLKGRDQSCDSAEKSIKMFLISSTNSEMAGSYEHHLCKTTQIQKVLNIRPKNI